MIKSVNLKSSKPYRIQLRSKIDPKVKEEIRQKVQELVKESGSKAKVIIDDAR